MKFLKQIVLAALLAVVLVPKSHAANQVKLKPDGANDAPCTVFGASTPGMSCGKITAPGGALDVYGLIVRSPAQVGAVSGGAVGQGIYVSTTIPATSSFEVLLSSGGDITLTSTPSIAVSGVADGTELILTSTDTKNIAIQDEGTLTGSKVELGAASRTITRFHVLTLIYSSTLGKWIERAYQ